MGKYNQTSTNNNLGNPARKHTSMSLSIGIVGLPNVGKSTLFNALTDSEILAANYPFATIEPNTGIVPVPDERLEHLKNLYNAKKVLPATVTFVDIAGLVAGASNGEGLGNQFLANIRQCDAIVHVVRAFENNDIVHVADAISPSDDIAVINTELVLADLQTIEKQLPKVQKEAKAKPEMRKKLALLEQIKSTLDNDEPLSKYAETLSDDDRLLVRELQLLTLKPVIYAFNIDEQGLSDAALKDTLTQLAAPSDCVFICAKLEEELRGLDTADKAEMLESYGVANSGLDQLIQAAYSTLGLQSYLTAGEKEVRAWTIPKGATAPQAAGVIHTDFERGFIAAQVVSYTDLMSAGSEQAAKTAGNMRTEGKTYVMQPDDVVEFRFNV